MKYKNLKNLKYIYWVLLNRISKLFYQVYTKKKRILFSMNAVPYLIL